MVRDVDYNNDLLIGYTFVVAGKITFTQFKNFIILAKSEKLYLTEVLYNYGLITRDDIIDSYSKYFSLLIVDQIENYRIKDHSTLDSYCNDGYFLGYDNHNQSVVVVNNIYMVHKLLEQDHQILLAHAEDFYAILEGSTKALSSVKASHYLGFLYPGFTAGSINYKKIVACGAVVFSFLLLWCIKLFLLMSNFIFFVQNFFKLFLCLVSWLFKIDIKKTSELENYPAYTILLPVYKEASQLENLVHYISNLIYPKSQLDVKLIVEEDDYTTLEKIKDIELPDYFHIIKVPYSFPRTKPKAMNYAMEYARGEYVAIYDADDRPDADQLIKALSMFRSLPEEYICVQAKLNYYNKDENLLTKLFSIEYSIWFEYLIKALYILGLPLPLGGTSNHFKVNALRGVGFWDAYNVTEDADLGVRLYSYGYKTALLDSYTLEESPISISAWMYQRSRWIKGYIQTFIVYLKNTHKQKVKTSFAGHFTAWAFVGFVTYSFFILPWILLLLWLFINNELLHKLAVTNLILSLTFMYSMVVAVIMRRGKPSKQDIIAYILWPFYFLLHSVASYKAIYDLIKSPFKWNKTIHGVSLYNCRVNQSEIFIDIRK
jgi:cellulose synthase/poly-beta-1,6-N-acetylglucosamine synthase-like glycosyltransferase